MSTGVALLIAILRQLLPDALLGLDCPSKVAPLFA